MDPTSPEVESTDEFVDAAQRHPLPPDTTAPGIARQIVAEALAAWRDPDDAVLVGSELASNALKHGLPPIWLVIIQNAGRARLSVTNAHDASAPEPQIADARLDQLGGRGLAMVALLSAEWGWSCTGGVMTVWAELIDSTDEAAPTAPGSMSSG